MKRATLTLLLCCAASANAAHAAQAAQWITAMAWTNPQGQPEVVWQYDAHSVSNEPGQRQAWLLTSFVRAQSDDGKYPHLSRLERVRLRCDSGTMAFAERLLYSRGYGRGVLVRSESFGNSELFVAPREGTPSRAVLDAICGPRTVVRGMT